MTLGERIKKLRKELDLTQQKFAEQIGTTQNGIASYEIGRREPSAAVVNNICKTFNVNEQWLRTGDGEMLIKESRDDEIAKFVGKLMAGEEDNFKRRFVAMLARLNESEWEFIEQKALELFEEAKKD